MVSAVCVCPVRTVWTEVPVSPVWSMIVSGQSLVGSQSVQPDGGRVWVGVWGPGGVTLVERRAERRDQAATCCPAKTQSESHYYCQDKLSASEVPECRGLSACLCQDSVTMELEFVSPIIFLHQIKNNIRNFLIIRRTTVIPGREGGRTAGNCIYFALNVCHSLSWPSPALALGISSTIWHQIRSSSPGPGSLVSATLGLIDVSLH